MLNELLSVIQWETCAAEIANRTNDLPLAIGNITSDFEIIDLITPNRLKLGRNNDKSPSRCVKITSDSKKILETNRNIINNMVRKLAPFTRIKHHPSTKGV